MPAEPRCPWCNASGINHIAIKKLPGAAVVYCGQCGAVYGVAPLPKTKRPAAPAPIAPAKKRGLLKNAPPEKSDTLPEKPPVFAHVQPDPLPSHHQTKKRHSSEQLNIDQLGAMLVASGGGMYYQIFNDGEGE